MKTLIATVLIASVGFAGAQDAPAPAETSSFQVKSSRYLASGHDEYVAAMKKRLAITEKKRGPFGLYQVPGTAPTITTTRKRTKQVATPFADVVKAISVSAVLPREQEFMIGSQVFRNGQQFSLLAGEQKITVRVAGVSANRVDLENVKSGEVVAKRLDLLPDGVVPSVGGTIAVPSGVYTDQRTQSVRVDIKTEKSPTRSRR